MKEKLRFVLTCGAFPEQYDVFLDDVLKGKEQVGYVRLRHGALRVDCPDCGGLTVYSAAPAGGHGSFGDDEERDYYLRFAAQAILDWLAAGRPGPVKIPHTLPEAPDVAYELVGAPDNGL